MSTQYTPGPWTAKCYLRPDLDDDPMGIYAVRTADDALTPRYYAANPETVAGMDELDAIHAENAANARLIAAAPKLLEALEWLIHSEFWHGMVKVTPEMFALIKQAREDIAEAKGELDK